VLDQHLQNFDFRSGLGVETGYRPISGRVPILFTFGWIRHIMPGGDDLTFRSIFIFVFRQFCSLIDQLLVVARFGNDTKFQAPQLDDQRLLLANKVWIGTRDDDFDTISTHASNGNFFSPRRIDTFGDGLHHLVDGLFVDSFSLELGCCHVDFVDEVGSPGEVDAQMNCIHPGLRFR